MSKQPAGDRSLHGHRRAADICRERTEHGAAERLRWKSADLQAWYGESHILHGVDLTVQPGRSGDAARPQRRRPHHHAARDHGPDRRAHGLDQASTARETIGLPTHQIAHLGVGYCPEERGIFASLSAEENLLLPPRARRPARACRVDEIYAMFPNLKERRAQPGHAAVGRRAADAGGRAHPAHRRAPAAARRDLRRPGAGDRADAGAHDPHAEGARATRSCMVEQNFRFAAPLADRFYVMEHGQIVETLRCVANSKPRCRCCNELLASDSAVSSHATRIRSKETD